MPVRPGCDGLACVPVQHPQQHYLRFQGLTSWCKVDHTGEREDGERETEEERGRGRERERELKRTDTSFRPLGHVAESTTWLQEGKVCLQYQQASRRSSRPRDTTVRLNGTNGFRLRKASRHLLSLARESQDTSVPKRTRHCRKTLV